jgi:hypothetical protein
MRVRQIQYKININGSIDFINFPDKLLSPALSSLASSMVFSSSGPHRLVNYTLTPSHRIALSVLLSRATSLISHLKVVMVKVKVKKVRAKVKARAMEAMEAKGAAKEAAIVSLFRIDDDPCALIWFL